MILGYSMRSIVVQMIASTIKPKYMTLPIQYIESAIEKSYSSGFEKFYLFIIFLRVAQSIYGQLAYLAQAQLSSCQNNKYEIKGYQITIQFVNSNLSITIQTEMLGNTHGVIPEHLINQLESEKQEISKIRKQRQIISLLSHHFQTKTNQIIKLQQEIKKYRAYYESYPKVKASLHQKTIMLAQKEKENHILIKEVKDIMKQYQQMKDKFEKIDEQRKQLIRQRHQIDHCNREIEETFKQYRVQCKQREEYLIAQISKMQKIKQEITQKSLRIQSLQSQNGKLKQQIRLISQKFEKEEAQRQVQPVQSKLVEKSIINSKYLKSTNKKQASGSKHFGLPEQLAPQSKLNSKYLNIEQENQTLRQQLYQKEQQLHRVRMLNNELSLEFDKSVNKICQFEKQLCEYRKQNHQLKKTLTLFMEKQKYQKQHKKQLEKHQSDEEDYSEEDSSDRKI